MTPETLDLLIHRWFEGTLSAHEEAELLRLLRDDPAAGDRFVELSELESGLAETLAAARDVGPALAGIRPRRFRAASRTTPLLGVAIAAAAAALFALLLLAGTRPKPAPEPPAPVVRREGPPLPPPLPEPPPPPPKPRAVETPPREIPPPVRPPEPLPPKPEPVAPPPPPTVPPPPPPPSTPLPPKVVATVLTELRGGLYRQGETVSTLHRRDARFVTDDGLDVTIQRNSQLGLERREDGAVRVTLRGTAFFDVPRRVSPFVVSTLHGDIQVTGTSFQVDVDDRRAQVQVLEGTVTLKNAKGEAAVRAGQRSSARAVERPTAPVKADVETATAWRRQPGLAANPERVPYVDHEAGANRRLPGVVVAAPFFEGEANAGALARAVAERADVGLVLGHHYRDLEKRIWVHLDRGLEAPVAEDRSIGETAASDRARKATADYLAQARAAAGVGPVPLLLQFRDHNLAQDGVELEVGEVAWSGWNRKTIADLKTLYAALLEKHRPKYRLELRFQGVDDAYDFRGRKRSFFFTEADARDDGYMASRHSRNALTVFLNPGFLQRGADLETYSRIFVEMIEFLHARRR